MNLDEIRKVSEELEALIKQSEAGSSKSYEEKKSTEERAGGDGKAAEPESCEKETITDETAAVSKPDDLESVSGCTSYGFEEEDMSGLKLYEEEICEEETSEEETCEEGMPGDGVPDEETAAGAVIPDEGENVVELKLDEEEGASESEPRAEEDTDESEEPAVKSDSNEESSGISQEDSQHDLSGAEEADEPLTDLMEIKDSDFGGLNDYVLSGALENGKDKFNKKFQSKERRPSGSYIRPSDGLLAAFLVPVVVMIIIFIQRGIFPFGDESFLRTDMYHQYAPFFSEFQHKLQTGGSLLYSWDVGMGVNFSALYAYYLASPLNWLLIICPKNFIIEFMTYNIVLKIGLSGLTFAYYLRKNCKTSDFGVAFFGIFYALSGYMAAYSWNIMWLDCILLFPLIMLGLERLVKEKKCFLYCITLGVAILSNYYISIMICIFMVLYFIVLLILEKKKSIADYVCSIVNFAVYSLVAGGLAAVVLLPEIYALQATASGKFNFPKDVQSYFSIFDMFARHLGNVAVETGLDHWPNIYCGVAVLIFFLLYLTCKKIPVREKVVYCGMLLFFYASFSVNVLNFIWHGFHYPNSLPCRQSFIYIFLMLYLSYRAYMHLKDISWKNIAIAFMGSVCFVVLAEKLVEQKHFEFYVFYVAIIMLSIYAGLLYLYKQKKMNLNILLILTLGVVSVEAAVNTTITSVTTTSRSSYVGDNKDVAALMKLIQPADTFYRVEKVTSKTKNDGAWMNFPSVSLFSSTASAGLTAFFKDIGCEGNTNAYSITGSTPLVDSLFSVKYGLYSEPQAEDDYLSMVGQSGDTYLYDRSDTLPLGFMVDDQFESEWKLDWNNPALVQNDLCNIIGAQPVLWEADGETNGNTYRFLPDISGEYYAYVSNRNIDEVTVSKGEDSQKFKNVDRGYLLELGYCEAGAEVVVTASQEDQKLTMSAYRFDYEGLKFAYNILNRNPFTVTKWMDDEVEGKVTADHGGVLFTTIPYDKGWSVWVDGNKREPKKMFGAFLGIDMTPGDHTVKLKYMPEGLHTGAVITGACVLFLLVVWGIHVIWKRKILPMKRGRRNKT